MKKLDLATTTVSELAQEFLRLATAKGRAVMEFEIAEVNRICWQIDAVRKELKADRAISGKYLQSFIVIPARASD